MKDWKTLHTLSRYLDDFSTRYPAVGRGPLEQALALLIPAVSTGATLYLCGNGGSAADADHIVGELMKGFVLKRPYPREFRTALTAADPEKGPELAAVLQQGIRAFSLNAQVPLTSAFANDVNYEMTFAQQVAALGRPGDILWCLSTSGNSANVLYAAVAARARHMKIYSMTAASGGKLKSLSDFCFTAPAEETFKAQEYHLAAYHCLCLCLEEYMYGEENRND